MSERTYKLMPHHALRLYTTLNSTDFEQIIRSSINKPMENSGEKIEYSAGFVDKLVGFYKGLVEDENAVIEIVNGPDDICALGCNNMLDGLCLPSDSQETKLKLERAFGVSPGDRIRLSDMLGKN
jgi:hypothetical protein